MPDSPRRFSLFPLWLPLVSVLLAALILAGVWALVVDSRPSHARLPTATPIVTILPLPDPSPLATLAAPATPDVSAVPPTPTPDADAPPTPSSVIEVHDLVQVVGTGVNGLNLRAGPGLDQAVNLLALDSEVFRVDEGPRQMDGFRWWQLVDLRDPARGGWAVENYLQVVQGN